MAKRLSTVEIAERGGQRPLWTVHAGAVERTLEFRDFKETMRFVNRVAERAEAADHHPDFDIRYNKVRLVLTTHSAGGLTDKDFALAAQIDELAGA